MGVRPDGYIIAQVRPVGLRRAQAVITGHLSVEVIRFVWVQLKGQTWCTVGMGTMYIG